MIYVVLIVIATGLALLIHNEEYVSLTGKGGFGPGGFKPWNRERARNHALELAIYLLMAGVSACRIAVGNDYWVYRENFKLIAQGRHVSSEMGFNLLVKGLVWIFGYDKYLPVFGFFSLVTVYFFVRALHDQGEHFAFSLFLLFTEGFYFNSLNTVRYYLALTMALFAIKYLLKGEWLKFVLFIAAGALFHKSILLVIPAYFAAYYLARVKLKKWHAILAGMVLASLIFGQDLYRFVIFKLYPFYEDSQFDKGRIPYKNVLICLGVLALCVVLEISRKIGRPDMAEEGEETKKTDLPLRFYAVLNLFGLVTFCCGGFIPEVSRIGYYMTVSQVFLVPRLVFGIRQKWLRITCLIGCIAVFTAHFFLFMKQMYLVDVRLLPYLDWIFH